MLETMVNGQKWTLRPMKKSLEDQLNSWMMYIPGMSTQIDKKELTSMKGASISGAHPTLLVLELTIMFTSQKCWTP
jgi:hypothetical protein